jgi:endonuclease III
MIRENNSERKDRIKIEFESQDLNSENTNISEESSTFDLSLQKYSILNHIIKSHGGYSLVKNDQHQKTQDQEVPAKENETSPEDLQSRMLLEELIEKIENFLNKYSPLAKILKDIEKLKSNSKTYELFKFRVLIMLFFAEHDPKQVNLEQTYKSILKNYSFTFKEMSKFTQEDFKKFCEVSQMKLLVIAKLKPVIKIIKNQFSGVIPENYFELKCLNLKAEVVIQFYKQIKGSYYLDNSLIPYDFSFFRLVNRFGLIDPNVTYADGLEEVKKKIPELLLSKLILLYRFGNYFCVGVYPQCHQCPLSKSCKYIKQVDEANKKGIYVYVQRRSLLPLKLVPKTSDGYLGKDSNLLY